MFCSPTVAPLDTSREVTALRDASLLAADTPVVQGGSLDALRRALREWRPHLFWFAGHGDVGLSDEQRTLGFSGSDGTLQLFDPLTLASELRAHIPLQGGSLECVVLNACCSGGALGTLGDLLVRCGVPSVVSWGSRAHNDASALFARGFAAAAVGGEGYTEAYEAGRACIVAQLEPSRRLAGVRMQRFELIDPLDRRVVQPADVAAGRAPPADLIASRRAGRRAVAAGRPRIDSRPPTPAAPRGTRAAAGRRLAVLAAVAVALTAAAAAGLDAALGSAAPPLRLTSTAPTVLKVEADALAALRAAPAPVCVLGVAGPAREGKSTLQRCRLHPRRRRALPGGAWPDVGHDGVDVGWAGAAVGAGVRVGRRRRRRRGASASRGGAAQRKSPPSSCSPPRASR